MSKKISFFEISYWCYYYDLGDEEFWSMVYSNNTDFEFLIQKDISKGQTEKTLQKIKSLSTRSSGKSPQKKKEVGTLHIGE